MSPRPARKARPAARPAGRPAARQARGRQLTNKFVLAFLVLLVLAGLYGIAGLSRAVELTAAQPAGPGGQLAVTSALVGCPAAGSGAVTGGNVAEASAPSGTGGGQVILTVPAPAVKGRTPAAPVVTTPQPGQLTVKTIKTAPAVTKKAAPLPTLAGGKVPTRWAAGGLFVAADGANAQGFDVEQLGPAGKPTVRCQAPGSDFWFVGPEATTTHTELYLMNPDDTPADAHVAIQTDSGPLLGAPDSGIVVPAHSMIVQNLDHLVHSARAAAFHVTTSAGRVVAAVRQTDSLSKPGIWLPAAQAPATSQVLTGLPDVTGTRELYITVPGPKPAKITVTAVSPRGSYQPTGGNGISLLGKLTTGVSIPALSGFPGSIKISSNVPVTAVLEVSGGPSGASGAFITGSAPITEQGVVAASPVGSAGTTELVLAAPGKAARVRIAQAIPGTALTGQQGQIVTIAAKSATKVAIKLPKRAARATLVALLITPQPGSGPVYAARLAQSSGAVQGVLPVISTPTRIDLPPARQSLAAVLGN